jgi:phosphopantetheinyl transferase (holo-ACP synthase)
MAVSRGTCGIDIQKITSKIIKVEQKFVDYLEKDFNKCACLAALPEKIFLTLVWSAKEALRKGSGHKPVIGFMEIKLCNVSGDRDTGFVFQFTCDRSLKGSQRKKRFTTWQNICDDFVVAFVRGENSCPEEEKST